MSRCMPHIDWSMCGRDSGFPQVLPAFYMASGVVFGSTGILYLTSVFHTIREHRRKRQRPTFNCAMQMHAWAIASSATAIGHSAAGLSPLPILLLYHVRLLCIAQVTTALVRHWVLLYQNTTTQPEQRYIVEGAARFVELYRDGEVVWALLTCTFFLVTVVYGLRNKQHWDGIERLQDLVWAIVSAVTCWLVAILGSRVHLNLRSISRSRAMKSHVRRVFYVAVGSSLLWLQCTACFILGAALRRPFSPATWLMINCGINITGCGVALIYYLVIGSTLKSSATRATASNGYGGAEPLDHIHGAYQKVVGTVTQSISLVAGALTAMSSRVAYESTSRVCALDSAEQLQPESQGFDSGASEPQEDARTGNCSTGTEQGVSDVSDVSESSQTQGDTDAPETEA